MFTAKLKQDHYQKALRDKIERDLIEFRGQLQQQESKETMELHRSVKWHRAVVMVGED